MDAALLAVGANFESFSRKNTGGSNLVGNLESLLENFDTIVNCIGYTAVDNCELNAIEALEVNSIIPKKLSEIAASNSARLIHFSTDYVFDGSATEPYPVDHPTSPLSAYGKSKELGERHVMESGADFSIIRTAWLYGAGGECFPKKIARILESDQPARVVNDQLGQPTWTKDVAEKAIEVLQLEKMPRIFHAVSSGQASWADFAKEVALSIGSSDEAVEEISSAEYPTLATRPAWSVLDNSSDVLTPIGDWRERWRIAAPEVLRGI